MCVVIGRVTMPGAFTQSGHASQAIRDGMVVIADVRVHTAAAVVERCDRVGSKDRVHRREQLRHICGDTPRTHLESIRVQRWRACWGASAMVTCHVPVTARVRRRARDPSGLRRG